MSSIEKPDYQHLTRVRRIQASDAKWYLASIVLMDTEITDPKEYELRLNTEMKRACMVLINAFESESDNEKLQYSRSTEEAIVIDPDGNKSYLLKDIWIDVEAFCAWALRLKYKLPKVLVTLAKAKSLCSESHGSGPDSAGIGANSGNNNPRKTTNQPKGGKPQGYLADVVEYVFSELAKHDKSGLSKPKKIREFIIFIKEMATKTSRYADEFVMERVKSIHIPEEGDCSIITADNIVTRGQSEAITRGRTYKNNDVAKILTRLRKNNIKI